MKIYVNIIWAAVGIVIAVFGFGIWKKFIKGIVGKIVALGLADTEGFIEFFGKSVVFLGMLTLASAFICINSPNYLSVSVTLQIMALIYFVLEAVHLYKRYKNTPPKKKSDESCPKPTENT